MKGTTEVRLCRRRGQTNILRFRSAPSVDPENLRRNNHAEFLRFINGQKPYPGQTPRSAAYVLDAPNIYLSPINHCEIACRYSNKIFRKNNPPLSLETMTDRVQDEDSPPLTMGWLCVYKLPKGKPVRALGLKRRTVLFVDGVSAFFQSLMPQLSQNYYQKQTAALSLFPSFLKAAQIRYPAILIEELCKYPKLHEGKIDHSNVWKIIRNGFLLELEN